jgi:hypothetical protein
MFGSFVLGLRVCQDFTLSFCSSVLGLERRLSTDGLLNKTLVGPYRNSCEVSLSKT